MGMVWFIRLLCAFLITFLKIVVFFLCSVEHCCCKELLRVRNLGQNKNKKVLRFYRTVYQVCTR